MTGRSIVLSTIRGGPWAITNNHEIGIKSIEAMFEDHFFLEIACRMNVRIKFEGRKGPRLQTVE